MQSIEREIEMATKKQLRKRREEGRKKKK